MGFASGTFGPGLRIAAGAGSIDLISLWTAGDMVAPVEWASH